MKEIGIFLKQTRVDNGVSIEEASSDLGLESTYLENLEEGNIKAFKDIYTLKDTVKEYSKYLGLDPDKVMDEFNDFMFEHTSKISLDEIKEARKNKELEEKPKVVSPYTNIPKKKVKLKDLKWNKILTVLGIIAVIVGAIFLIKFMNKKEDTRTNELKGKVDVVDECTY